MTMVVAESKLTNETGERVNNLKSKLYLYLDGEWFDKTFDLICEILDKKLDKNYKPKEEMEKYILELKHFLFNN